MARKQIRWTEEKINQYIKEGRGQGEGENYEPWLKIGDFSSHGRCHRILDHKTGRIHHFFSDLEANYYYLLAWSDLVVDVREQYPLLPRSETEQIAEELGYKHPRGVGSAVNEIMTTDFLISIEENGERRLEARHVKYGDDFRNRRTCEKREIEERYWQRHGVPFRVVTEKSINPTRVKNIKLVLEHYVVGIDPQQLQEAEESLLEMIPSKRYEDLASIGGRLERMFGLKAGDGLHIFYHLAAHKRIPIELDKRLLLGTSVADKVIDWSRFETFALREEGITNEHYA